MKDETKLWLKYADENYQSSKILLESIDVAHRIKSDIEAFLI